MKLLLQSGRVGRNETQEEILAAWIDTGLLEGLSGDKRIIVANAMERAAKIILTNKFGDDWNLDAYVFPIIRRVCSRIMSEDLDYMFKIKQDLKVLKNFILNNIDIEKLLKQVNNSYELIEKGLKNISEGQRIFDFEAETCFILSDYIAKAQVMSYSKSEAFVLKNSVMVFDEQI